MFPRTTGVDSNYFALELEADDAAGAEDGVEDDAEEGAPEEAEESLLDELEVSPDFVAAESLFPSVLLLSPDFGFALP